MSQTLAIDGLEFDVRRSARRRTIGITIERDGTLVLHAPADTPEDDLAKAAASKLEWVHTKLAEKELLLQPASDKRYLPGETHSYLGRNYRLRLVDAGEGVPPLQLSQGWFELRRDEHNHAARHFPAWYAATGREWLERRVGRWASRIGVDAGPIDVRDLGFRWGSCGVQSLNFHWRTLTLPPRAIDYVIAHELVHVEEPVHSTAFWERLRRAMPDMERRKRWLAEHGGNY